MALKNLKKVFSKTKEVKVKEEVKSNRKTLPEELHVDYDPGIPVNKQRHLR